MSRLEFYERKRVLVTGAAGYIGSALAHALNDVDCQLVLQCHNRAVEMPNGKAQVDIRHGNLEGGEAWAELIDGIDVVFHLADRTLTAPLPGEELAMTANSVLWLLEACRSSRRTPCVVLASTANIHGHAHSLPVDESFPERPLTSYAVYKLLAENFLDLYARDHGIPSVALRLVNTYGPAPDPFVATRTAVNRMIRDALTVGRITTWGNHQRVRDFLHVDDAVAAFLLAPPAAGNAPRFLVGSGEEMSYERLAGLIAQCVRNETGRSVEIHNDAQRTLSRIEERDFLANTNLLRERTNWRVEVDITSGIGATVREFALMYDRA